MSDTRQEFLHNSGANIFYSEYFPADPQAPTLILLHGNGEDHTYFVKQIPAFSPHFRLVLMDTRGQGQSTGGDGELNFSVFAADLLALMDHLQIAKAHLLGFSDGGNLALTFALAHPERVQSLILNGANLEPGGVKLSTQLPIVLGYGCCRLLSPFSRKARQNGAVLGLMVNHPHIPPQALAALTMPALVIVGERDMIRDRHSQLIARSLPNAQFVRIPGGDHFCAAKCPEAFNRAVLSFCKIFPHKSSLPLGIARLFSA